MRPYACRTFTDGGVVMSATDVLPNGKGLLTGERGAAAISRPSLPAAIALSVIVPTYNERDNVAAIVGKLDCVLQFLPWEVIFVDDASPDDTAHVVREIARVDRRVRLISRHNRRGLSSAVIEGGLAAAGEVIAVMDGDLQHDEGILPELYRRVAEGEADIASASRFLEDHASEGLANDTRLQISHTGISAANKFFGLHLTDPLTGFFAMRRADLERTAPDLSGLGFKILLDLITSMDPAPRVSEVPFRFRPRVAGESKLDHRVMYDFGLFFLERSVSRVVPIPGTWLSLAVVSALGVVIHLALIVPAVSVLGVPFIPAQLAATLVSLFATFSMNNLLSRGDSTLQGRRFWMGFAVFGLLSAAGVAANVGVAALIHTGSNHLVYVVPAIAGAIISVPWNFAANKAFAYGKALGPRRAQAHFRRGTASMSEGTIPTKLALDSAVSSRSTRHHHLIKYFLIGGTASAIDVMLFMLLFNIIGTGALVAHSISVPTSVMFSFVVNVRHNFKTVDHTVLRLFSFVVVCTIGYLSGYGVIELCRQQGIDPTIGKLVSLPLVFVLQYVLNSRITFYKPGRAEAQGAERVL